MLKIIMDNSRHIAVKSNQAICDADPSDDKIINLAIDANCGTIVTKNISHFRCLEEKDVRTKKGRKIEVYTPQQFVDNFKLVRWASQSKAK
jgi:predicted nucleic acid-binding protein